jgi:hypothetical protein
MTIKEKQIKKYSGFLILLVFLLGIFVSSFYPGRVYAQSDAEVEQICLEQLNGDRGINDERLIACVYGYDLGYGGAPINDCENEYDPSIGITYAACGIGWNLGSDALNAKDPDNPEDDEAAKNKRCEKYSDLELEACVKGWENRKSGDGLGVACTGYSGPQLAACEYGWGGKDVKNKAKGTCAKKFPNDKEKREQCKKDEEKKNEGAASEEKKDKTATDCDTELSSPLSWILCPIIDMGAAMSDFVFEDLAKPLLSDVPVSADPKDPDNASYTAWQGFRFLANIMVIGSMLAIVYAQTRGDG